MAETDDLNDATEEVIERPVESDVPETPPVNVQAETFAYVPRELADAPAEPVDTGNQETAPQVVDVELPELTPELSIEVDREIPAIPIPPILQPMESMVREAKRVIGIEPAQEVEPATQPGRSETDNVTVQEDAPQQESFASLPEQPAAPAPEAAPVVDASLPEQEPTVSEEAIHLDLDAPQNNAFYIRTTELMDVEPQLEIDALNLDVDETADTEPAKPIAAALQMPTFIQARLTAFKETANADETVIAETETQTIKVEQSVAVFVEFLDGLSVSDTEEPEAVIEAELAVAAAYGELLEMIGIDDEEERQELVQAYITTIRQHVIARQEALAAAGQQSQLDYIRHFFIEGHEVIKADPAATPFTQNLAHIIKKFTRLLGQLTVRSAEGRV